MPRANGIPSAALTAYQRAQTVINAADTACHLPWQLVAAIGRVESDHGRVDGSRLDSSGLASPAIHGIPLDGSRGTARIDDTDAGLLDGDVRFDRAVGPMQFIPSTWSVVGVDADGDAERNPQDIDDASLATAVYLCSGDDDLATDAGRRSSVFRYNHSQAYVDLVLAFYDAYVAGVYTAVPNSSGGGGTIITPSGGPARVVAVVEAAAVDSRLLSPSPIPPRARRASPPGSHVPADPAAHGPADVPADPAALADQSPEPTKLPTATPTSPLPTVLPTDLPTTLPTDLPTSILSPILSLAEAIVQCTAQGLIDNPLSSNDAFDQCVDALTGG